MNLDEKIKAMDFWMKVFMIVGHVMIVIALSTFVWGETDENGGLVGLGADVAVISIVIFAVMILGVFSIVFTGLFLCVKYSGDDG